MARYRVTYRRRIRREMAAQQVQLGGKVVGDGIAALVARGIANASCRGPHPDYMRWQAFNDVANKKAEDFWYSILTLGASVFVSELVR